MPEDNHTPGRARTRPPARGAPFRCVLPKPRFLDVGTGLPTVDNTHEIAQRVAPDARVVYVDNDPLVLAHARALLAGSPEGATDYVDADVRDPRRILDVDVDVTRTAVDAWNASGTPHPIKARTSAEIEALFAGLELLEPGVVSCPRWRPEPSPWGEPEETMTFCGVARKLSA
ncbi:SAM-dependent methyltransferase [Actinomadura hallensis]|uniref:SAM-dependent methyltransferase n=1 Tax=Actinomadura hallensis TaxID=337895 RepID=UPI0011512E45|nr:SAM-dependent methyltransferase [Actinomadura hallensis]